MQSGDRIQDRYVLQNLLGRGGMGEVWLARDARLERGVALKLLSPRYASDADFLVRFFSEAQSVARLNHPHVVPVLDFGHGRETPFLVMEFLEGGSLDGLAPRSLTPERAFEIVAEAARGAGAAHSEGVIHRDVKPGNILLTRDGVAKLADFGIASSDNSEALTETGSVLGSPYYISPEQASGKRAGPRSDVYSLGVVLYELLTGKRPFEGDNVTAVAIAHFEEDPRPPSALRPELPEEVDRIVMRCLSKDPADRFTGGTELASVLSDPGGNGVPAPGGAGDGEDELSAGRFARNSLVVSLLILLGVASLLGATWWAIGGIGTDNPGAAQQAEAREPQNRGGSPSSPTPAVRDASAVAAPAPEQEEQDQEREPERSGGQAEESEAEEPAPSPAATPTTSPPAQPSPEPSPTDGDPEDSSEQD